MADMERVESSVSTNWDFERNREFFGLEDWAKEDIDAMVEAEEGLPGNEWMLEHPMSVKRVYVMSVLFAKEQAPTVGRWETG